MTSAALRQGAPPSLLSAVAAQESGLECIWGKWCVRGVRACVYVCAYVGGCIYVLCVYVYVWYVYMCLCVVYLWYGVCVFLYVCMCGVWGVSMCVVWGYICVWYCVCVFTFFRVL